MTPMRWILAFSLLAAAGCSPDVPKLIPRPDDSNEKVSEDDAGVEVFNPEVDVLFIVDDSGSMGTHQNNLIQNIDRFVAAFTARTNIDYHIGVLTSSMEKDSWGGAKACCGELVGSPKFVDRSTPGAQMILKTNLRVGTGGAVTEKFFEPLVAALSPPMVNGPNAGFYRSGAYLAVVFITDAEEQSRGIDAKGTFDFLVGLKGRPERIISYGVIVPSTVSNCSRDSSESPQRLESFLSMMPNAGNNVFSLCDPLFGDRISGIADDLVRYVGNMIVLNRPPVISTIRVTYGNQEIPRDLRRGWSFDAFRNAIIFGDDVEWLPQPEGTKVKVYYEAATFPDRD